MDEQTRVDIAHAAWQVGALILAEIERLDRAALAQEGGDGK